ncbi:hypothetical protein PV646_39380 [Streptomyces sp. ID05-26A]|nr:hypothetical protein [Streptomyces sp. ID05-26A]
MKTWGVVLMLAVALVATAYFATRKSDSTAFTDEKARQVAERIGYPVPRDADAYARAALQREPDQESFAILEITDRKPLDAEEVRASLVFRIHDPGVDKPTWNSWQSGRDPVTACYRADFNYYGVMDGGPESVPCPAGARPIVPPPVQRTAVPDTYPDAVKTILTALPPASTKDEVLAALRAGLPPMPVDPESKLPWADPRLDVFVEEGAVGVVAASGTDCLNGVRLADGTVASWYPPRVQTQPGEIGCSGEAALTLYRTPPPH